MMIPYSFKLGRATYGVLSIGKLPKGHVGEVHYASGIIKLAWTGRGGKDRTHAQRCETFWHEVTHAILQDMGSSYHRNEMFVTEFSKRLDQVIKTARLT